MARTRNRRLSLSSAGVAAQQPELRGGGATVVGRLIDDAEQGPRLLHGFAKALLGAAKRIEPQRSRKGSWSIYTAPEARSSPGNPAVRAASGPGYRHGRR